MSKSKKLLLLISTSAVLIVSVIVLLLSGSKSFNDEPIISLSVRSDIAILYGICMFFALIMSLIINIKAYKSAWEITQETVKDTILGPFYLLMVLGIGITILITGKDFPTKEKEE